MRINDVVGLMTSVYDDWGHILVNPRYRRSDPTIDWINNDYEILPYPIRAADVGRLASNGQYTFQISEDGSLIQLRYVYDGGGQNLIEAGLAYYAVLGGREDENADTSAADASGMVLGGDDESAGYGAVRWLRIDYQPQHARGVLHGESHLHIGGFPDARFLVRGVPTPKQFIEFIVAACYPDIYREHRLADGGGYADVEHMRNVNIPSVTCAHNHAFGVMTHLVVPAID